MNKRTSSSDELESVHDGITNWNYQTLMLKVAYCQESSGYQYDRMMLRFKGISSGDMAGEKHWTVVDNQDL